MLPYAALQLRGCFMRRFLLLLPVVFAMACGSDDGKKTEEPLCLTTLPDCPSSTCLGRVVRNCSEDGTEYQYELCFNSMCKNGLCQSAPCFEPDKSECVGPTTRRMCLPTMSAETEVECEAGSICVAGACVPSACSPNAKACGWKATLVCAADGTSWQNTACTENQYCDPDSFACTDMNAFCVDNPGGATCVDLQTAGVCNNLGKLVTSTCTGDQVCVDGFCQEKVCGKSYGSPTEDTTSPDQTQLPDITDTTSIDQADTTVELPPLDIPPLEKPAKAWVTITGGMFSGEKISFTSGKSANYVVKDTDLQIGMAKGMYLLELHFQGIEEGVVGHFTSAEPGSVAVLILFNDGTNEQTEVQWEFQASAYDVTLDAFEAVGGRVQGSFSGTLQSEGGEVLELTDGYFDVPRKQ